MLCQGSQNLRCIDMNKHKLHDELDGLLHEIAAYPAQRVELAPRLYKVISDLAIAGEQPSPAALSAVRHLRDEDTEGHFENMPV